MDDHPRPAPDHLGIQTGGHHRLGSRHERAPPVVAVADSYRPSSDESLGHDATGKHHRIVGAIEIHGADIRPRKLLGQLTEQIGQLTYQAATIRTCVCARIRTCVCARFGARCAVALYRVVSTRNPVSSTPNLAPELISPAELTYLGELAA
jgi:hypothetical protein